MRESELEMIEQIIRDYSEWIEAYNLNPYKVASIVLATRLKIAREREEIHNYVRHAR